MKALLIILSLLLLCSGGVIWYGWQLLKDCQKNVPELVDKTIIDLSVWETIQACRIQHPEIVYAQYKLESRNGNSNLFVNHNNAFGMMYPLQRPTTAIGSTSSGYAKYSTVRESVIDYAIWQSMYFRNLSHDLYLINLDVYAEDENYIHKLKKIINESN